MHDPLQELRRLREWRGRAPRDPGIASSLLHTREAAARTHRRLGQFITLWEQHVPKSIASRTALTSIRAGVLQVRVDSAATAFELDRLLRSGLLATLRRHSRSTLTRVKTRVEPLEPESPGMSGYQRGASGSSRQRAERRTTARTQQVGARKPSR